MGFVSLAGELGEKGMGRGNWGKEDRRGKGGEGEI